MKRSNKFIKWFSYFKKKKGKIDKLKLVKFQNKYKGSIQTFRIV